MPQRSNVVGLSTFSVEQLLSVSIRISAPPIRVQGTAGAVALSLSEYTKFSTDTAHDGETCPRRGRRRPMTDRANTIEVRPYGRGRAIYVNDRFVSDHYSQDSLAAAWANIVTAVRESTEATDG